jgi:3-deoxy-D-manno-octulosonate 8-phosphate phosphatase (KDO 8-P phosphatase)
MVTSRKGKKAKKLPLKILKERAARIRLVLTDNDGVLTDSGVYYSADGESFKRFSIRDGMGVELLRNAGIASAIITSETSESVRRRAEKLRMPHLYMGITDKRLHLDTIISETKLKLDELAYIGDDVNDLGIIEAISHAGLTGAPADATHAVKKSVHYCSAQKGGNGAFRDFGDWILRLRSS